MQEQMLNLKNQIDSLLKTYLEAKKKDVEKGSIYEEIFLQIQDLIFRPGAEHLRPILVYYGYKLFSNNQPLIRSPNTNHLSPNDILYLSLSTELFHTAALIHDDIMDQSKTRRGGQTIHEYFAKELKICHSGPSVLSSGSKDLSRIGFWSRFAPQNDDNARELGKNLAILAGDLCLAWADEIFTLSKVTPGLLLKVKKQFDLLREEVIFGQSLDLVKVRRCTRSDLIKIYEYKTARYTFLRPLLLGAVLAGTDKKQQEIISKYAIPVGIAFQIQDDILDDETELMGTKKECKDLAINLVNKGKKALLEYNDILNSEAKDFLLELADYCIHRRN